MIRLVHWVSMGKLIIYIKAQLKDTNDINKMQFNSFTAMHFQVPWNDRRDIQSIFLAFLLCYSK